VYWGERDSGLIETARMAHERGIKVLLKPHLWLRDRSNGAWTGSIAMESEDDWQRWFARYEEFIVHYAGVAEAGGMDALCIGRGSRARPRGADWRRVIAPCARSITGASRRRELERRVRARRVLGCARLDRYPGLLPLQAGRGRRTGRRRITARREDRRGVASLRKLVVFTEVGYKAWSDRATVELRAVAHGRSSNP
jgi:hypothetical protein